MQARHTAASQTGLRLRDIGFRYFAKSEFILCRLQMPFQNLLVVCLQIQNGLRLDYIDISNGGRLQDKFVHLPLPLVTAKRRKLNIASDLWRAVLESTGQGMLAGMLPPEQA